MSAFFIVHIIRGKHMEASKHWTNYWDQGHRTSFGANLENNYQGQLRKEWQQIFSKLIAGQCVLDLCTGNATLIRLAEDSIDNFNQIRFIGVDYANLQKEHTIASLDNVEVYGNTNIEQLPIGDSSIDLVISNFGIEYSNFTESLSEVSRVLRSGGQFEFICHHEDSLFIKDSNSCLVMLNRLHQKGGVLFTLESMLTALKEELFSDAEVYRNRLNEQLSELVKLDKKSLEDTDFLSFLKFVMSNKAGDKLTSLKEFKKESENYQSRLNAMVNAALTKNTLKKITFLCQKNNIKINKINEVCGSDGVCSYHVSGQK